MAPVKKQKAIKSPKNDKEIKELKKTAEESVISGQLQKKINKKKLKPKKDPRGVVFIKHLPHGFFEEQLQKYFEQFGNVTRVRLARSRRTGNSKGYAFVEFVYPEVAEVAAETMNNYLMFKKIVKAAYIPPEKQQFNYFRTNVKQIKNKSGKKVWVSGKTASIQQRSKQHNDWSDEKYRVRTTKQLKKIKKITEKYAHLGIDFNSIVVPPKTETEDKQKNKYTSISKKTNKKEVAGSSNALKRTTKNEEKKQIKKNIALEDLLGNTIQEDSEDEDYIATPESFEADEINEESSDEETYGFTKGSDIEEDDEACENNEDSEEDEDDIPVRNVNLNKTKKTAFGRSLKASRGERLDHQIIKRKPHTGGIQKLRKKITKQPSKSKVVLQLAAAKELAKPMKTLKGKLGKPVKPGKVNKKVK